MTERSENQRSIEPVSFNVVSHDEERSGRRSFAKLKILALAAFLCVLVFGVFIVVFVLPGWVDTPEVSPRTTVSAGELQRPDPSGASSAESAQPDETIPAAELPTERKNTQELLAAALGKLDALQGMQADNWAKSEMHAIRESIGDGEKAYREKRYNAAQNIYLDAAARIDRLLAQIPDFVGKLVDAGYLALDQGDSAGATNAFKQVLEIETSHEKAQKGLARAQTLDQVLALIGQAEGYERLGQMDQALGAYREALKIDADAPGAAAAATRIQRTRRAESFRAAMSSGLKALETNQFDDARDAFERARKIDQNSPEASDALRQLDNAEATFKIARALKLAGAAESSEKWDEAARQYESALKIDPRLSAASEGKRNAEIRHRLQVQLTSYLARPERLATAAVRTEVESTLATARTIADPGSGLSKRIEELQDALVLAQTPVTVEFRSNNATSVTLYRVGDLGSFDARDISLLPGAYTAVGKRDGYRDVRVEFKIEPGEQRRLVTVQCEEKFAFGS